MKRYKKYSVIAFLTVLFLTQGQTAFAGETPAQWFNRIIDNAVNMVIWPIFLGLVVIMLIWAGILFLTAAGDPTKISQAKKAVIYAIIGIIVAIFAFSAVRLVRNILGLP